MKEQSTVKPPLGLVPKIIHDTSRLHEVRSAIARYYDAGLVMPIKWVKEYNQLIKITKNND